MRMSQALTTFEHSGWLGMVALSCAKRKKFSWVSNFPESDEGSASSSLCMPAVSGLQLRDGRVSSSRLPESTRSPRNQCQRWVPGTCNTKYTGPCIASSSGHLRLLRTVKGNQYRGRIERCPQHNRPKKSATLPIRGRRRWVVVVTDSNVWRICFAPRYTRRNNRSSWPTTLAS